MIMAFEWEEDLTHVENEDINEIMDNIQNLFSRKSLSSELTHLDPQFVRKDHVTTLRQKLLFIESQADNVTAQYMTDMSSNYPGQRYGHKSVNCGSHDSGYGTGNPGCSGNDSGACAGAHSSERYNKFDKNNGGKEHTVNRGQS